MSDGEVWEAKWWSWSALFWGPQLSEWLSLLTSYESVVVCDGGREGGGRGRRREQRWRLSRGQYGGAAAVGVWRWRKRVPFFVLLNINQREDSICSITKIREPKLNIERNEKWNFTFSIDLFSFYLYFWLLSLCFFYFMFEVWIQTSEYII
jgi:hypothetical protein